MAARRQQGSQGRLGGFCYRWLPASVASRLAQQPQHPGRVVGRVDRPQSQPRGGQLWNVLRPVDTGVVVSLHRPARLVIESCAGR